jgi:hypothetical protein
VSVRKLATVLAVLCAAALLGPVAAGARAASPRTTGHSFTKAPVTGRAHNGKKFTGTFTVNRFVRRNGKPYAVGTLAGKLGHRSVKRSNVALPVTTGSSTPLGLGPAAGSAAVCPILHLVLGPLNLNLLGLNVHLNQVVLNITATSGPGNLLGNLLCGVAGLLDHSPLSAQQATGLLNIVQQLLNMPGLLKL